MSIVTADIHQGLYRSAIQPKSYHHPYLTFWHWSGVTPYTSSYEFAWSCVFGKQLPGNLSLRPLVRSTSKSKVKSRKSKVNTKCIHFLTLWTLWTFNLFVLHTNGKPYPEVTAAFLPSSLRSSHSFALVYSTRTPVSVFGTVFYLLCLEAFLGKLLCLIQLGEPNRFCFTWGWDQTQASGFT